MHYNGVVADPAPFDKSRAFLPMVVGKVLSQGITNYLTKNWLC